MLEYGPNDSGSRVRVHRTLPISWVEAEREFPGCSAAWDAQMGETAARELTFYQASTDDDCWTDGGELTAFCERPSECRSWVDWDPRLERWT